MTLLKSLGFQFQKLINYKDPHSLSLSLPDFTPSLQHHRNNNQHNTNAKRKIQLLVLAEDEHGEDDAIDRLQIISQVDGEGGNLLQYNDLQ